MDTKLKMTLIVRHTTIIPVGGGGLTPGIRLMENLHTWAWAKS